MSRGATPNIDARRLAKELAGAIRGEVRFDDGSRALYATDASNYRQVPIGVVIPADVDDILATLEVCRRFGAPILSRGAGTSLAGQCCNVAVVIDFSKNVDRILALDPENRLARVEPGAILDDLRRVAEKHGLTFGPDPATHGHCTIGGMIGNDSCGVHSVLAAFAGEGPRTGDNIAELDIVTYDGVRMRVGRTSDELLRRTIGEGGRKAEIFAGLRVLRDKYAQRIRKAFPDIPRRVSGYNLPYLLPEHGFHIARALAGAEGTCVTVLEATLHLVPNPPVRFLVVAGFKDIYTAADYVPCILEHRPIGLEGFDAALIGDMRRAGLHRENLRLLPEGQGWLLIEFGADTVSECRAQAQQLIAEMRANADGALEQVLFEQPERQRKIWEIRESGLGATAHVPGQALAWEGWEDSAVPPEKLGPYLRDLYALLARYAYRGDLYGHFGQGCVHTRINFDLESGEGIRKFRAFVEEAADLVISYGGSLSGEHGDGQSRAELLPKMFGPELVQAFREFKAIWDPEGKMNPGKIVDPYRLDENFRLGLDYEPLRPATHFSYADDEGDFPRVLQRCVGVGKCRRRDGGTMCPSFMVTHEEKHSTRGRARLLFEMLRGGPLRDAWREKAVKEALDLCLACKACKSECPVGVDMATYKAEFLSHYYEGRLRPRAAYAFGWLPWWARLASAAPGFANLWTQTPGVREVVKWAGGIASERRLPPFAPESFTKWFRGRRPLGDSQQPAVILWADTFNNYFHPETARAAVAVLEAAGFRVVVADKPVCCGRPLYDFGMLDLARRLLLKVVATLRSDIRAGLPVIVLEPSCAAVFRDELPSLLPNDEDALRLSRQTFLLSEFLEEKTEWAGQPPLARKAIVQMHCHQRAVLSVEHDIAVLEKVGLELDIPDSGCCGMAGAFGFERGEHYEVSIRCGERVLLPHVRAAAEETLVIANGFSCREQIHQSTGRNALHLAEVLHMALQAEPGQSPPAIPVS